MIQIMTLGNIIMKIIFASVIIYYRKAFIRLATVSVTRLEVLGTNLLTKVALILSQILGCFENITF